MSTYKQYSYTVNDNGVRFQIKFDHIVDEYKNGEFEIDSVSDINLKFYRLCRYNKQKHIYDVFRHCPSSAGFIVHLEHAFKNEQYALVDYFLLNFHKYTNNIDYVIRFIADNQKHLVKQYRSSANSVETDIAMSDMAMMINLNTKRMRFIELTRLLVNTRFKLTMKSIFDPNSYAQQKSEVYKNNYKKLVDPMIDDLNYMQMWFLIKILQRQNNPLLDLRKMLYLMMQFMREPLFDTYEEPNLVVYAAAINFVLISDGCNVLRYST
jgi:hypothetical protein